MTFATADLFDEYGSELASCETQFASYGARERFAGPVATVRCWEDNALLKKVLATPGEGRVLVIDGGGSLRTALMGDLIAGSAVANGWAGVVINGAVRDVVALRGLDLGIRALGSNPRKSAKEGTGEADVPVTFGGVEFRPGAWLYADEDGIVVADRRLT
ncbi:ribonuclease E activity regulator RraA [Actinoallomurus rhizosphaericola]|uniref:ribonuclease E activity regulator RraA n=1 Tax=Actinoallomurus rhizosphaericola TaxID=2952536 RepID=UPI0020913CED|nr:ribonuclease E activity regulator RraA [Actinoallomurus rhizosphaericola]MCO5992619.1 ribonuclease E activity regulator RraA [Actinoallomurus rhizosphaericola]